MIIKYIAFFGLDFFKSMIKMFGSFYMENILLITIPIVVIYCLKTYIFYKLAKTMKYENKVLSFIPIFRNIIILDLIKRKRLNILLFLILLFVPVIGWISNIILLLIYRYELSELLTEKKNKKIFIVIMGNLGVLPILIKGGM